MNVEEKVIKICDKRAEILASNGHILVEGGPGFGKTTIALLKAKDVIDKGLLSKNQKILFLSFARATVGRVEEQAGNLVTNEHKRFIEINTYHGFSWQLIQSYGYLTKSFRSIKLITPPNLFARTSNLTPEEQVKCKKDILDVEGVICFDLFCEFVGDILQKSNRVCSIISDAYPYIIVDEFQDTDEHEWRMIKLLGAKSVIISLADLEQRIYEFRGASISRIPEFITHFKGLRFDLGKENNRSANTDIVQFGDDLLTGTNIGKQYTNVTISRYTVDYNEPKFSIKTTLSKSIARLKKSKGSDWSIALLVKSKQDTLQVSSYLSTAGRMPQYFHEVLIDPAGPSLAANVIAQVIEPQGHSAFNLLTVAVMNHLKGRKNKISENDIKLAQAIEKYLSTGKVTGKKRLLLISELEAILLKRGSLVLKGIPEEDWLAIRRLFGESTHEVLKNVFEDAKYLKLLNRGAILSERLSEVWRLKNNYENATAMIDDALTQEHFSMTSRKWHGIFIMTIHKSKGKEFDEVIIWDEQYRPLVSTNSIPARVQQDRIVLRVAATRARNMATFLTPAASPCILL